MPTAVLNPPEYRALQVDDSSPDYHIQMETIIKLGRRKQLIHDLPINVAHRPSSVNVTLHRIPLTCATNRTQVMKALACTEAMAILGMPLLKAFFLHISGALALLLAFCHFLPRLAFTLAYLLRHDYWYALALLISAAVTRHQSVNWWRAVVMQKAVGAKSRHQRARQ